MDFLMEWLKQIILFVLIAIVIDLLLPSNKMKKYVQLIMGLILIILFLQPVFSIFKVDISEEINRYMTSFDQDVEEESMDHLINLQKTDIQASTDAYILEEMSKQLIHEAEEPLLEEHSIEMNEVVFYFQSDKELTYESLRTIEVYVQHSEGNHKEVNAIEQVEEVIIHPNEEVEEPEADVEPIIHTLKDVWEVHDKEIKIVWGEGLS